MPDRCLLAAVNLGTALGTSSAAALPPLVLPLLPLPLLPLPLPSLLLLRLQSPAKRLRCLRLMSAGL